MRELERDLLRFGDLKNEHTFNVPTEGTPDNTEHITVPKINSKCICFTSSLRVTVDHVCRPREMIGPFPLTTPEATWKVK